MQGHACDSRLDTQRKPTKAQEKASSKSSTSPPHFLLHTDVFQLSIVTAASNCTRIQTLVWDARGFLKYYIHHASWSKVYFTCYCQYFKGVFNDMHWQVLYVAHPLIFLHLITLKMDSFVVVHARWEEDTTRSCADGESPQLCGKFREWLRYLFLVPKELGIYETCRKCIPRSTGKLQAHCSSSIRWNSCCWWFMVEFGRKSPVARLV